MISPFYLKMMFYQIINVRQLDVPDLTFLRNLQELRTDTLRD